MLVLESVKSKIPDASVRLLCCSWQKTEREEGVKGAAALLSNLKVTAWEQGRSPPMNVNPDLPTLLKGSVSQQFMLLTWFQYVFGRGQATSRTSSSLLRLGPEESSRNVNQDFLPSCSSRMPRRKCWCWWEVCGGWHSCVQAFPLPNHERGAQFMF